ncbi:zinc ribbon domain-containing protein [Pseudoalteromonas rubra]|uniref:Zinc ribbon domain-containing protein n=1 Tax=Pseudoalteromonas rubra TaxID=43658 RepID=A0A4Q7EAM9_9GAMM|nr:zinc ribbon domain-containing protein [Pseudoalteromonas rubra]RZM79973.1 hypothetical protein C3B51_13495 [Pseudoalteromonas rubra]
MAIAQCPSCNKPISSKHKTCPHCHFDVANMDEESLHRETVRRRIKKQQKIMNYSFLALILFLGGFLYLYWQQPVEGTWEMLAAKGAIGVGLVWYLVNRVILVVLKKKK